MAHGDLHKQFAAIYDKNDEPWPDTLEAIFHRKLSKVVSKRTQGYVMGAFREALAEFIQLVLVVNQDNKPDHK